MHRTEIMNPNLLDELSIASQWQSEGKKIAIATVVETGGSAPRSIGSKLVIDSDGNFEGSVSGGCVAGAVISEALDVIDTGISKVLEFGVSNESAWEVGLACGGKIKVLVSRLD